VAECDHRLSVFDLIEILFQRPGQPTKEIKHYFILNANSFLPNLMACPVDTAEQEALVKKGWKLGRDLKYLEAEGAEHNERAWAQRVEPILTFLFPRKL
jgi:hypothetical protein